MRYLQPFISHHANPLWLLPFSLINKRKGSVFTSGFGLDGGYCEHQRKRERGFNHSNRAVERDSEFEIDPDKAREALRKLDQQFQSISQKQQISPSPKVRASNLKNARDEMIQMNKELPDYSGSFLAYSAFALLIFTIFYNVLFITVIQPSIDGQEPAPTTQSIREASERTPLMQFPASPQVSAQP